MAWQVRQIDGSTSNCATFTILLRHARQRAPYDSVRTWAKGEVVAHKHVDLAVENVQARHRLRGREILREFESRHHSEERTLGSLVAPALMAPGRQPSLIKRLLPSIAVRTDAD
ncbi:MAG: hypothetical protein M3P18_01255 [Actinomycetota bacterium]|nr:hypothetical protein [Actinomycetota bacterium]